MQGKRWLLPMYLLLAPFLIACWQILVLNFPTSDPEVPSAAYSPYPRIFYLPLIAGLISAGVGWLWMCVLCSEQYRHARTLIRLPLLFVALIITAAVFWIALVFAQRSVAFEWLSATNANGLDFLIFFTPSLFPVPHGAFPLGATFGVGALGLIGILIQYLLVFRSPSP